MYWFVTLNLSFFIRKMWIMMFMHRVVVRIKWGIIGKAPVYLTCRRQSINVISCFIFVVFVNSHVCASPNYKWIEAWTIDFNYLEILSYEIYSILLPCPPFPFSLSLFYNPLFLPSPRYVCVVHRCVKGRKKDGEWERACAHSFLIVSYSSDIV